MDETATKNAGYMDKSLYGARNFLAPKIFSLHLLICAAAVIGPCMAADAPALQKPVPAEVQALVPTGMKLIFFRADNGRAERSDAIAILEQAKKSADPNESTGPRPLIMLRKTGGVYKEEARNDKIIACSNCGEDMDDPFTPDGIELTPDHLVVEQDHGPASSAVYKFMRDPKSQQWIVVSAVNTLAEQSMAAGKFIKTPTRLKLPTPPFLTNFDPGWRTPQFWNAVVVNDKTHDFSFLKSSSNEKDLDERIDDNCKKSGVCHVLAKQLIGCVALVKGHSGIFYAGSSSTVKGNAENKAKSSALNECAKHSPGACEAIRSDCSQSSK